MQIPMFMRLGWDTENTYYMYNSFLASGDFCLLLIFANSLDPDQDRQNLIPDLDPNCLTLGLCS